MKVNLRENQIQGNIKKKMDKSNLWGNWDVIISHVDKKLFLIQGNYLTHRGAYCFTNRKININSGKLFHKLGKLVMPAHL